MERRTAEHRATVVNRMNEHSVLLAQIRDWLRVLGALAFGVFLVVVLERCVAW